MTEIQSNVVCRLLGGTGRARLIAVPMPKLPALLLPPRRSAVVPFVQALEPLPLAA